MCGSRVLVSSVGRAFAKAVVGYEGFLVAVDCLLLLQPKVYVSGFLVGFRV